MQDTEEVSGGDLFTVHKVYNPLSLSSVYSNLENKFNNCAVLSLPLSNVWKITLFIQCYIAPWKYGDPLSGLVFHTDTKVTHRAIFSL